MAITGRCYCGSLRYKAEADPVFRAQCHCRECQYFTGGNPNVIVGIPEGAFSYVEGTPASFTRNDLGSAAATREFCGTCGTPMATRAPGAPGVVIVKVGTLDDPSVFGGPQIAMQTADKLSFHHIPEGIPAFERFPG